MARQNAAVLSLNGGAVSPLALSRVDLPQLTICGEVVENWMVSTLGWMGLRPGTQDNGLIRANQKPQFLRFIGSASTCSLLELTPNVMRIWNDDQLVTRNLVGSIIINGSFPSLDGWTTVVPPGGSVSATGASAVIAGNGTGRARLLQQVNIPSVSAGVEHGLRIIIDRGPVTFKIGIIPGDDSIVPTTELAKGVHSLAIALSGTVFIEFSTTNAALRVIKSVNFEAPGVVEIPTPWDASTVGMVRYDQQGDVLFCAHRSVQQQRIESRSRRSWSVVEYVSLNGPFRTDKTDNISMAVSGTSGIVNLTASQPVFKQGHVNAVFELTHIGQMTSAALNQEDVFTDPIRVTGIERFRKFNVSISGDFVGTVYLEQAIGAPEGWQVFDSYTAPAAQQKDDGYDNSIVYYRLGFRTGSYTSGTALVSLIYPGGTTVGRVRVRNFNSSTSVQVDVIEPLASTNGTTMWREQAWSDFRGWPRGVAFQDGRLIWLGKSLVYGSVSDDFANFDDATEGDSAPVVRSIATGPADGNLWIVRLFRLIVASATAVTGVRSSSLDEPLTKTQFTARDVDQFGAADIMPVTAGGRGVFVGRSGIDLFEVTPTADIGDYALSLLSRLNPDITAVGIVKIAVQRRPEPRIWCVLMDGTIAILTYNKDEKVIAWQLFRTAGFIEECEVLPNVIQDDVFLCVRRTLNGTTARHMERCSYERNTVGNIINHTADCARAFTSGTATTTLTGLSDFEGKEVAVWAPSRRGYRRVVSGGLVTIDEPVQYAWVGLAYDASFKSTKLAYAGEVGTALMQTKKVDSLALLLANTARIGVKTGRDFDHLDPFSVIRDGEEIDPNMVEDDIDEKPRSFDGSWDTDSRFCIKASSPWPCRVQAVVAGITTHDAR